MYAPALDHMAAGLDHAGKKRKKDDKDDKKEEKSGGRRVRPGREPRPRATLRQVDD
jgi:hypothetical protein